MLCVLLGPSVASSGEGSGAGGYAEKFGMRSVPIPAIAFIATIVSSSVGMHTRHGCVLTPPNRPVLR